METQTKLDSLREVLVGSMLTISTALIFNVTVLPLLLGVPVGFLLGAKVTALYTTVSLAIRFGVRRYYNAHVRRSMRELRFGRGSIQSIQGRVHMPFVRGKYQDPVDGEQVPESEGPDGCSAQGYDSAGRELTSQHYQVVRERPKEGRQGNRVHLNQQGIDKGSREDDNGL